MPAVAFGHHEHHGLRAGNGELQRDRHLLAGPQRALRCDQHQAQAARLQRGDLPGRQRQAIGQGLHVHDHAVHAYGMDLHLAKAGGPRGQQAVGAPAVVQLDIAGRLPLADLALLGMV